VEQNRGAALDERERLAPEAEREAQGEVGGQQRVRPLARQVRRRPRNTDHDRVEALVERRRTGFDCAQQRLGMRDGRWPGKRGRRAQLAPDRVDHPVARERRQQRERGSER
jgi:hypothetical protein